MAELMAIMLIVGVIIGYAVAFQKAKYGQITVYCDWSDFGWSLLWILAWLACLLLWPSAIMRGSVPAVFFFFVFVIAGIASSFKLFVGAFKNNATVGGALWSLFARFFASIFAFVIIGKIFAEDGEDANGKPNLVLMFLRVLLYGFIFNTCVKPLVRDNRSVEVKASQGLLAQYKKPVYAVYCLFAAIVAISVVSSASHSTGPKFDFEGSKAAAISYVRAFLDNDIGEVADLSCGEWQKWIEVFESMLDKTEMREAFREHMQRTIGDLRIDENLTKSEAWMNPCAEDWASARDVKQADVRVSLVDSSNNYHWVGCHLKRGWLSWKVSRMELENPIGRAFLDFEQVAKDKEKTVNRNKGRSWPKILVYFVAGCVLWYGFIKKRKTIK